MTELELITQLQAELSRLREFEAAARAADNAETDEDGAAMLTAALVALDKAREP